MNDALSRVAALDDLKALARERLTPEAWAYFSGGAADELPRRANLGRG